LNVMERLHPHIILRKGLIAGVKYPRLSEHMAEHFASTLFHTSSFGLSVLEKKKKELVYIGNRPLCEVTELVIFTEPYIDAKRNHWTTPYLDEDVIKIRDDAELKSAISELKLKFMDSPEALIHGDLHTGSVMVTQDETYVIDFEFTFYGPMGFDIGAFIGNLMLSYFSQDGSTDRSEYKKWILRQVEAIWDRFSIRFIELWDTKHKGGVFSPQFFAQNASSALKDSQRKYLLNLLHDTIGFAAAKMIRRIVGVAHVADLESINDPEMRAKCERKALIYARETMVNRTKYHTIQHATSYASAL